MATAPQSGSVSVKEKREKRKEKKARTMLLDDMTQFHSYPSVIFSLFSSPFLMNPFAVCWRARFASSAYKPVMTRDRHYLSTRWCFSSTAEHSAPSSRICAP
jgi:hypothetical protein